VPWVAQPALLNTWSTLSIRKKNGRLQKGGHFASFLVTSNFTLGVQFRFSNFKEFSVQLAKENIRAEVSVTERTRFCERTNSLLI
jgi:hypothetical protein